MGRCAARQRQWNRTGQRPAGKNRRSPAWRSNHGGVALWAKCINRLTWQLLTITHGEDASKEPLDPHFDERAQSNRPAADLATFALALRPRRRSDSPGPCDVLRARASAIDRLPYDRGAGAAGTRRFESHPPEQRYSPYAAERRNSSTTRPFLRLITGLAISSLASDARLSSRFLSS